MNYRLGKSMTFQGQLSTQNTILQKRKSGIELILESPSLTLNQPINKFDTDRVDDGEIPAI